MKKLQKHSSESSLPKKSQSSRRGSLLSKIKRAILKVYGLTGTESEILLDVFIASTLKDLCYINAHYMSWAGIGILVGGIVLVFLIPNQAAVLSILASGCLVLAISDLFYRAYVYFFCFAEEIKQELIELIELNKLRDLDK